MTYKRKIIPQYYATGDELTSQMIGIGFHLFGQVKKNANIENTLVATSIEGMRGDWRVLGLLVDWLDVHVDRVLADRLVHMVLELDSKAFKKVRLFWCAFAQRHRDIRFKRLLSLKARFRNDIVDDLTGFLVQRNGEDERFSRTCLRVPKKLLRHRLEDVMAPEDLAKHHVAYRYRVLIGSTPRADMFACLEDNKAVNAYALAKQCYGSYRTAMVVKRDYGLLSLSPVNLARQGKFS